MKSQAFENKSLDDLKKIVASRLSSVGVKQGVSKPGDGHYSALLKKNYSK